MAKARIGHFVEAQVLEALGVDYIDESEVLTPADETNHIDKHAFKVPFVCGCRNLGEALRRINEGAAMIRTKGEAGTGNIVEAVRQLRDVLARSAASRACARTSCSSRPRSSRRRTSWSRTSPPNGKLPVVNFVAGGISTPADAALVMQLGAEGVFVGSGIFKSEDPARMANAIVQATTFTSTTRRSSPRSRRASAPRCAASPSRRSRSRSASPSAAGRPRDRPALGRSEMKIGVLGPPGAFREHLERSTPRSIGVEGVRGAPAGRPLRASAGLILPGGESTTMRQLIERWGPAPADPRPGRDRARRSSGRAPG